MTPNQDKLRAYARLAVRQGVNVTEGIYVLVQCPIIAADFGRMVMEEAFACGAKDVIMLYNDDQTARIRYENAALSQFETLPAWRAEQRNYYAREGTVVINIIADDPAAFDGVPSEKLMASVKASKAAFKEFYDIMGEGRLRWTIVAYPCEAWAKMVFPAEKTGAQAVKKLWDAIFTTVRITRGDPVTKWQKHDRLLKRRARKMNQYAFAALEYHNSIGTDFTVQLPKGHIWLGGSETSYDGIEYFPNMPTEEIFTMPHCMHVDGTIAASMPLSYQGCLIENFCLTFRDGLVTEHHAEKGEEALTRLLETDAGSRRLGEVALIPFDSPIRNLGLLFYNTLFDENASCHVALGRCYPETIKGGVGLSKEDLYARGGNDSVNHVDFMIGTRDLTVTGITESGERIPVFENGNFVF